MTTVALLSARRWNLPEHLPASPVKRFRVGKRSSAILVCGDHAPAAPIDHVPWLGDISLEIGHVSFSSEITPGTTGADQARC